MGFTIELMGRTAPIVQNIISIGYLLRNIAIISIIFKGNQDRMIAEVVINSLMQIDLTLMLFDLCSSKSLDFNW